jgi:CHAD domain-containing protein
MRVVEEREDKFEVDPDWVMPQVKRLVPDGGRVEQEVLKLENTYFDTPSAGLRLFGVTLRRRIGGSETGWQLKVPNGTSRTELQSGSRARKLPPALAHGVEGLRVGESIGLVATLLTTRTVYQVLDADGELVLEIADDEVETRPPDAETAQQSWREVEVELGPAGKEKDLKRAGKLLRAAGASPSTIRTKLDRALAPPPIKGQAPAITSGTVGELVAAYVAAQCDVLASNDVALRTGVPAVHQTRVAARRLRSTLRIFGKAVDAARAEELNNELVWYADLLGQVRDREVLSARLATQIADLPPEQVRGPVEAEITKILATGRDVAMQRLSEAMRTPRYQRFMKLVRGWKIEPPLSDVANVGAKSAATYAKGAKRKADKQLSKAGDDIDQLHRARKAMKRARYAAELVEPADGRMKRIANQAKDMQTLLGEHQDAIVAAYFLSAISAASNGDKPENGFTYGVLMASELNRAADIRESLRN